MNLNDFKTENMSILLDKLATLTKEDTLVWTCVYPIDLSDPNKQTFYFNIEVSEVENTIYFERNYDPVCVGYVAMFYWYDVANNKEQVLLDYTDENVNKLITEIENQTYRNRVKEQVDNINALKTMVENVYT